MTRTSRIALLLITVTTLAAAGTRSAPQDVPKPPTRFSHIVKLPTSEELETNLAVAPDYLKAGGWARAIRLLQWILDHSEDAFVAVPRPGPDGKETVGWVSARSEARRLLGTLPAAGLELY